MRFQQNNVSLDYVKSLLNYLKKFLNGNNKVKRNFIKNLSKRDIKVLCMTIYNILHNKIPINTADKEKLFKFRKVLHKFCKSSHTIKKRKEILQQSGGYLNILLPAAISGLSTIISTLISNKKTDKK